MLQNIFATLRLVAGSGRCLGRGRRDLRDRAGRASSAWRLVAVSLGPAPEPGTSHTTDTELPALSCGPSHNIAICVMFCKTERAV